MKNWEKAFKKEISEKTDKIKLADKVKNASSERENTPSNVFYESLKNETCFEKSSDNAEFYANAQKKRAGVKRGIIAGICSGALACALIVTATVGGLFNPPYTPPSPAPDVKAFSACVIEINPAVAFETDSDNKVTAIKSLNSDADVLLSIPVNKNALAGKNLKDAAAYWIKLATEAGYIDCSSQNNAVRISNYGLSEQTLSDVSEEVKNRLNQSGIYSAILTRELNLDEFCAVSGVTADEKNEETVKKAFDLLPPLMQARNLPQTAEEIKKAYEENVIKAQMYPIIAAKLYADAQKIIENATILANITSLNLSVMSHADNPQNFFKDYWSVKTFGNYDENGDFGKLMQKTQEALDEYERKFGTKINSLSDYTALIADYKTLTDKYGTIENAINTVTKEDFVEYYACFIKILKNSGGDVENFNEFLQIPETLDDYMTAAIDMLRQTLSEKIAENADKNAESRPAISATDYENYIAEIIEKYGSLENFWNAKNA